MLDKTEIIGFDISWLDHNAQVYKQIQILHATQINVLGLVALTKLLLVSDFVAWVGTTQSGAMNRSGTITRSDWEAL